MSETMKTRMTAKALLVATMVIRRNAAPEKHHAISGGRAARHSGEIGGEQRCSPGRASV
jgi:hypothetical protein